MYLREAEDGQMKRLLGDKTENLIATFVGDRKRYTFFKAVDENRFIYYHQGWEGLDFGCGLYDLRTGEDSIILLEEGMPDLLLDNKLYTSKEIVDLETLSHVPHAQIITDWPEDYYYHYGNRWVNAPDGSVMCCVDSMANNMADHNMNGMLEAREILDDLNGNPVLFVYDVIEGEMKGYWKVEVFGSGPLYPFNPQSPPYFLDANTVRIFGTNDDGHLIVGDFQINKLALEPLPQ